MLISFFKTKEKEKGSSIEANIYIYIYIYIYMVKELETSMRAEMLVLLPCLRKEGREEFCVGVYTVVKLGEKKKKRKRKTPCVRVCT